MKKREVYFCECGEEAKAKGDHICSPKKEKHKCEEDLNGNCYYCGKNMLNLSPEKEEIYFCECGGDKHTCTPSPDKSWVDELDKIDWEKYDQKLEARNALIQFIQNLLSHQHEEILGEFLNQKANVHDQKVREFTIDECIKALPEEGIEWMQEGNHPKEKKGFTFSFNQALSEAKDKLNKLKTK